MSPRVWWRAWRIRRSRKHVSPFPPAEMTALLEARRHAEGGRL